MTWIDVDLPEVIDVRHRFFDEGHRYHTKAASILDRDWLDDISIAQGQRVLFIAEGTFMYFAEKEVKALFQHLVEQFPGATLLFEVMGDALAGKIHPSVKCLGKDIPCHWGIGDYHAMEGWSDKLTLKRSDIFIDFHRSRWTWPLRILTKLFPRNKQKYGHAIIEMKCG